MKYIKKFINWLGEILKETIAQTFTLLGFFIAWLTLTGTAKDIVGIAILISIGLWLLTIGLRKDKPENKNKKKVSR
jgi:putative Mn2+ efflux pump MntP